MKLSICTPSLHLCAPKSLIMYALKQMTILGIYVMATYLQTSRNVTLKSGMKICLKILMIKRVKQKCERVKEGVQTLTKVFD